MLKTVFFLELGRLSSLIVTSIIGGHLMRNYDATFGIILLVCPIYLIAQGHFNRKVIYKTGA